MQNGELVTLLHRASPIDNVTLQVPTVLCVHSELIRRG